MFVAGYGAFIVSIRIYVHVMFFMAFRAIYSHLALLLLFICSLDRFYAVASGGAMGGDNRFLTFYFRFVVGFVAHVFSPFIFILFRLCSYYRGSCTREGVVSPKNLMFWIIFVFFNVTC